MISAGQTIGTCTTSDCDPYKAMLQTGASAVGIQHTTGTGGHDWRPFLSAIGYAGDMTDAGAITTYVKEYMFRLAKLPPYDGSFKRFMEVAGFKDGDGDKKADEAAAFETAVSAKPKTCKADEVLDGGVCKKKPKEPDGEESPSPTGGDGWWWGDLQLGYGLIFAGNGIGADPLFSGMSSPYFPNLVSQSGLGHQGVIRWGLRYYFSGGKGFFRGTLEFAMGAAPVSAAHVPEYMTQRGSESALKSLELLGIVGVGWNNGYVSPGFGVGFGLSQIWGSPYDLGAGGRKDLSITSPMLRVELPIEIYNHVSLVPAFNGHFNRYEVLPQLTGMPGTEKRVWVGSRGSFAPEFKVMLLWNLGKTLGF